MAVQYESPIHAAIPAGMFSTADLLLESRLTTGAAGKQNLTVNLLHPVNKIEKTGRLITAVKAYDLLTRTEKWFFAKNVVLAAGTIESAKIAQMSGLDPTDQLGKKITDHPIFYTHFSISPSSPFLELDPSDASGTSNNNNNTRKRASSKLLFQPPSSAHPYNILLEVGTDFNQGRFVDNDILQQYEQNWANKVYCEVVFLFHSPLVAGNQVVQPPGDPIWKPKLEIQHSSAADSFFNEITTVWCKRMIVSFSSSAAN
jgi:hypothetical protein